MRTGDAEGIFGVKKSITKRVKKRILSVKEKCQNLGVSPDIWH